MGCEKAGLKRALFALAEKIPNPTLRRPEIEAETITAQPFGSSNAQPCYGVQSGTLIRPKMRAQVGWFPADQDLTDRVFARKVNVGTKIVKLLCI
jgi:hypothetical protein